MKKDPVTMEDLRIAIAWLECNEGEGPEQPACQRAAKFLQAEFNRRHESMLKRMAARHGCTVNDIKNLFPANVNEFSPPHPNDEDSK